MTNRPTHRGGSSLTRRNLLSLGGTTLLTVPAAGCDAFSTDPADSSDPDQDTNKGPEAPMLAERVQSETLPPVEERLPTEPLIIKPTESMGVYGGTWNNWIQGMGAEYVFDVTIGYDFLVRWDPDWTQIIPNLADSWDVDGDGLEYVFHLREGVKWSDGEPFTADDVVFAFSDVASNADLFPVPPARFVVDEQVGSVEKIDQYTLRFSFPAPHGLFLEHLATPGGYLVAPRHYLEQFHEDYNEAVEEIVDDEDYADWAELFHAKNDPWMNSDLPVLNAWQVQTPLGEGNQSTFERNPYYWKTDPDGSQLPYFDHVVYDIISDLEVALLKTTTGDIDFNHPTPTSGVATAANKPVLARSRDEGEYRFVDSVASTMNHMVIAFNLTHEDPQLRDVFRNKDFRVGLSHAINREELIDGVFQQQGEPWQAAPREESGVFHEELAKQYLEYDIDLANEHLDTAGFTRLDNAGFRLRPDGKRIRFTMDVVTEEPEQVSALEMIEQSWAEVGVEMRINSIDRTLFYDRKEANLHDANVWTGGGGGQDVFLEPRWYFPFSVESNFGILWARWYNSGGQEGEEPPEPARQQMALYDQLIATRDEEGQRDLFTQILDIAQEEFWAIGTVLEHGTYGTVRTAFHNVGESMPGSWLYPSPGPTRPEQYWKEN